MTTESTSAATTDEPVRATAQIGVIGLAVMGRNLARNFARHGYTVALHNRSPSARATLVAAPRHRGRVRPGHDARRSSSPAWSGPGAIIIMVKAGAATDAGDRRARAAPRAGRHHRRRRQRPLPRHPPARGRAARDGLHFVGAGVSGGEEGALNGPSIMPGGPAESYAALGPILESIAAQVGRRAVLHARRPRRRRPLRQDGPQRHRVRRHAAHRRGLRPAPPGPGRHARARSPRSSPSGTTATSSPS